MLIALFWIIAWPLYIMFGGFGIIAAIVGWIVFPLLAYLVVAAIVGTIRAVLGTFDQPITRPDCEPWVLDDNLRPRKLQEAKVNGAGLELEHHPPSPHWLGVVLGRAVRRVRGVVATRR